MSVAAADLRYALRTMEASGGGGAPRGDDSGQAVLTFVVKFDNIRCVGMNHRQ